MTPGQTLTLATNVTLTSGGVQVFGPVNTKLCVGTQIYGDSTGSFTVNPLEGGLPGQVNPIYLAQFTTFEAGELIQVSQPTPTLEVRLSEPNASVTIYNLYVYCVPPNG
jgi:hypothetical protein